MASKYHKNIEAILKEADLPDELAEELRKELESHFYEKTLELEFLGVKGALLQQKVAADFGDQKVIGQTLKLVHTVSFHSLIYAFMKKLKIALPVFIVTLLFWSPWMADDGGERAIWQVTSDPESRLILNELSEKYNLSSGYESCDGVWSTWAPFGRTVHHCAASWYVAFWGHSFYLGEKENVL